MKKTPVKGGKFLCGWGHVRRTPDRRVIGTCQAEHIPQPGNCVVTDAAPLCPWACRVFTAAELEERIAYYAGRAERGLPLFRQRARSDGR